MSPDPHTYIHNTYVLRKRMLVTQLKKRGRELSGADLKDAKFLPIYSQKSVSYIYFRKN